MKDYYTEPERSIPVYRQVDVCVVGGSQSGVAAAVCAARNGAKVLLVERNPFLGGQSVATMVTQWKKLAFINNLGAVCARGIAKEFLDSILAKGGSDQLFFDPPGCEEMRDGEEWLDIESIKLTLLEFCETAGVDLLVSSLAVDTIVDRSEKNPKVTGVIIENKSGRQAVLANVVVDASADLDVVFRALGEEGVILNPVEERLEPEWYVYAGGVDNNIFIEYVIESDDINANPSWTTKYERIEDDRGGHQFIRRRRSSRTPAASWGFSYPSKNKPDKIWHHLKTNRLILLAGFRTIIEKADQMDLLKPFKDLRQIFKVPQRIGMKWVGHDTWCISIRGNAFDATDAEELSRRECLRVKLDSAMMKILQLIPGWDKTYIARSSFRLGLRETRLLRAVTMLTADDILDPPDFDRPDRVGRSGGHDPGRNYNWKSYPIPFGVLVPEKLNGVICTARPVGAADLIAKDAHRGIVPTTVMGQAAGTAAALSVNSKVEIRDVDVAQLQDALRKADVVLEVETIDLKTIPNPIPWETQKIGNE